MKALLIQAPCWQVYTPPYNMALLKAVCRQHGHEVVCLDYNIRFYHELGDAERRQLYTTPTNWYQESFVKQVLSRHQDFIERCIQEIMRSGVQVVGFTTTGLNSFFSKELARGIKEKDCGKTIVFGGPYCFKTEFGDSLLHEHPYIDAVFYLEAEESLPWFLDAVAEGKSCVGLQGVNVRTEQRQVVENPPPVDLVDIDSLPAADYSDFVLEQYTEPELPLSTSRGCVNRCLFCSESRVWKTYRYRRAESVFSEIHEQTRKYPKVKSFYFNDSLMNGNVEMLAKLCDLLIVDRTRISWGGQAAISDRMSPRLIKKMRKAGFSHVSYGLETASNRMLRAIGKRFTSDIAQRVIRDTKKAGVRTDVNVIVGFPGETEEDIMQTANFLKQNRKYIDEIFFHPLAVTKGSFYYEQARTLGIDFQEEWNPNSWYISGEDNNLSKRLNVLEFYRDFIGRQGESFFAMPEYYSFVADKFFAEQDFSRALEFYHKAQQINTNALTQNTLNRKIRQAQERVRDFSMKDDT